MALSVLNPRPEPMNQTLAAELNAAGFDVISAPAIDIIAAQLDNNHNVFNDLDNKDWLFTSKPAVHHFITLLTHPRMTLNSLPGQFIAIGKGTAQALAENGYKGRVIVPSKFDSETLVIEPALKTNRPLVLVKGEGGRTVIRSELSKWRPVTECIVYKREIRYYAPSIVASWCLCNWFIITSLEVGLAVIENLVKSLTSESLNHCLQECHWLALSERIKQGLVAAGVQEKSIYVCEQSDNMSIINTITKYSE